MFQKSDSSSNMLVVGVIVHCLPLNLKQTSVLYFLQNANVSVRAFINNVPGNGSM